MIHGLPNGYGWLIGTHRARDWTDGCIAVTDDEMDEIWRTVDDGTPIETSLESVCDNSSSMCRRLSCTSRRATAVAVCGIQSLLILSAIGPMPDSHLTTEQQIESLWALGGLSVKQLATRVWTGIDEDNLLGRAAELAYSFILSVFPLLLFLLSLFGLFAARGILLQSSLLYYLSRVLPPTAFELLTKIITEITQNTGTAKVSLGIGLALFSASGGVATMISALNGAYGVRESRSWFKVRGIALGLTAALSILVLTALVMVLAGGAAADYLGAQLGLGVVAVLSWKVVQFVAALLFVVVAFSLIYFYGPDLKEQHWYWITPGSLIGVLLWFVASFAFRAYLHFFNTYSNTYGSLGAAIILLIWFYVTGFAFLIGGEINAEIENAAAERGHPEAKAAGEKAPGTSDPAPAKKVA